MTTEERAAVERYVEKQREIARRFGAQGGKARAKALTPEQRSEAASKAARVRWATARAQELCAG